VQGWRDAIADVAKASNATAFNGAAFDATEPRNPRSHTLTRWRAVQQPHARGTRHLTPHERGTRHLTPHATRTGQLTPHASRPTHGTAYASRTDGAAHPNALPCNTAAAAAALVCSPERSAGACAYACAIPVLAVAARPCGPHA
jgi:hypothetical protein